MRLAFPLYDFKPFVPVFQPRSEEHHVVEWIGYIKVKVVICLDIVTRLKVGGCIGAEGSVDGVKDKEIGMVSSKRATHIPR